jgi:cytochrome c551/c552
MEGRCTKLTALVTLISIASPIGAASAQEALAKRSGCLNCHVMHAKKVVPAFKDVTAA